MSFLARFRARSTPATPDTPDAPPPVDLEPREFLRQRVPDAPLLDVRTSWEFAQLHLEGARNLDVMEDDFLGRVHALGLDPQRPVYLYCRTGNRSGHAARMLREQGFPLAFNVGGLEELADEGAGTGS